MKLIKYKQENSEVERKIIEKGDNRETLETPEENQIYLNNLIHNKRYYIQKKLNYYEGTMPLKMVPIIFLMILVPMSEIFETLSFSFSHQVLFSIVSSGVFTTGLFASFNISALIFACKSINSQIQELNQKCSRMELKAKNSRTFQNATQKSDDAFIELIQKNIIRANDIQYLGFEQDVHELYLLATQYAECKYHAGFASSVDILIQDKKWIQELAKIEMRINHGEALKKEQEATTASLSMIRALCQEKVDLENISTPISSVTAEEETTGNNGIVLTLGGK